ncbi:phosphoribosylanthranilate isomerase [bacterium]|nr:phosphoribosylanthranilate isomerase [bacterium]
MHIATKICGIRDPHHLQILAELGTDYAGLVAFDRSPRHLQPEAYADLMAAKPRALKSVLVTVDMGDEELERYLTLAKPDYVQLHGNESPERAADIKSRWKTGIIKAIRVKEPSDILTWKPFRTVADTLLFDAASQTQPGGTGESFPWNWLKSHTIPMPWLLAGGLNAENLTDALKAAGAKGVDISSGLESSPGVKDQVKIRHFMQVVSALT